jgi:hypothetical protein
MQNIGWKQVEQEQEYAFLESIKGKREEKGHSSIEMGQAHHTIALLAQRRGGHAKTGPRGASLGARALGVATPPMAPTWLGLLPPTAINAVRTVRAWVR